MPADFLDTIPVDQPAAPTQHGLPVPAAALPHMARAAARCRTELAALDAQALADAAERAAQRNRASQFHLLRRAAALASRRRFDEAATMPGSL